jgi:hypothetical protein
MQALKRAREKQRSGDVGNRVIENMSRNAHFATLGAFSKKEYRLICKLKI